MAVLDRRDGALWRMPSEPVTSASGIPRLRTVSGVAVSLVAFLATQVSMLLPGWTWNSFRTFFMPDQLANFAVEVNATHGNFAAVEPYTETGHLEDPHFYLEALGAVARVTGLPPATVWTLGGLVLQLLLVACISIAAALVTRRWWAACLGAVPFVIGTALYPPGAWATSLQSHGVLWGAFAVMFPLNEASAALALVGSLLVLLVSAALRGAWSRPVHALVLLTGIGVGLTANIDTYSFFTAVFFAAYGTSVLAMACNHRRWPWLLSLALLVALYATGAFLATSVGRLDSFALGLVPALPGLVLAALRWRARVLLPAAGAIAAAAPQFVTIAADLARGDPFLTFRQTATAGLGVPWQQGLECALPLLIPIVTILLAGLHDRRPAWVACSLGPAAAWFVVATNDAWGPNQEPYQLWIDGFALTAFAFLPALLDVAVTTLSPGVSAWRQRRSEPSGRRPVRAWEATVAGLTSLTILVVAASAPDWYSFYRSQQGATMSLATPEDHAMQRLAGRITNRELVMTDPCISTPLFKAVTGARVAWYNLGLAWPARLQQIDAVGGSLTLNRMYSSQLAAAGIGWLVTQASCSADWPRRYASVLERVATTRYPGAASGELQLWRFKRPAGA